MFDALKSLTDKLALEPEDEPLMTYGCEFSQESMDKAPPVELEEDDG